MKSWIARLRISAALDAEGQPAAPLRLKPGASAELRAVQQEMVALDALLREAPPRAQVPASLHSSIMQAVRAANHPAAAPRRPELLRWLAAPALAAIILIGAVLVLHRPAQAPEHNAQSLAAATTALQLGNQMVRSGPIAVVAPLSNELDRLNQDLDNTARFLLASLP